MKRSPELQRRAEAVVRDFGGIISYAEAFYIESIYYPALVASSAFDAVETSLLSISDPAEVAFSHLHEALTHAAAVSRFFFPPRARDSLAVARADKLKLTFNVSDHSPLGSRELRNVLEHFEERLDDFLLDHPFGILQPWPVVGRIEDDLQGTLHRFKLLDPEQGVCVILGSRFELVPLRLEIDRILSLCTDLRRSSYSLTNK